MNDKDYRIILPLTLDGITKYGDLYDVNLCDNRTANFLIISGTDFDSMNIDEICLELYKEYGFLLGDGDYYFLDSDECKILKDYLLHNDNVKKQLSSYLFDSLINLCDEAIHLSTGLGFDF